MERVFGRAAAATARGLASGPVGERGHTSALERSRRSCAGSVDATGLASALVWHRHWSAHTARAGDVQLVFAAAPEQVDATSSAGDVNVVYTS